MLALFQARFSFNTCYVLDWIFVKSTIDNASRYIVYGFVDCTLYSHILAQDDTFQNVVRLEDDGHFVAASMCKVHGVLLNSEQDFIEVCS